MTFASTAARLSMHNSPPSLPVAGDGPRVMITVDAVGGVWRYAMTLAAAMRPFGASFVFVGMGPRPAAHQWAEAERLGELVWTDEQLDWTVDGEARLDTLPETLKRLARIHSADLLHLNLPSQARKLDVEVPVLVVSHSCVVTWWEAVRGGALPAEWEWQKAANRAGFDRADAIVAPSCSHADLLDRCYGPISGLTVVHNAAGGRFGGGSKEHYVFAAARWWDDGKNGRLLDAAAADAGWPVVAAGAVRGPNGQALAMRHVEMAGELPHDDVVRMMGRAAIVVSPSLYEPFGLAALEGARAGAALVLSDIPTYRELWDGAALFFDPADPQSLSAAIRCLADDADRRRDLGARALARSQCFTPEMQGQAMAALYSKLLGATVERRAARA